MKNRKVTVYFIRHGKTALNEKRCYVGVTDESLSENGRSDIENKAISKIYPEADIVFVSPLKRALETAEIIYTDREFFPVEGFREMDFGSFEGKNYEELKDNVYYRRWIDSSAGISDSSNVKSNDATVMNDVSSMMGEEGVTLPEDKESFIKRNVSGFYELLKKYDSDFDYYPSTSSGDKGRIAIVAHGGTIMAIASTFTGEDYYSFQCGCGEVLRAEVEYIKDENGHINVSCFSTDSRIHS